MAQYVYRVTDVTPRVAVNRSITQIFANGNPLRLQGKSYISRIKIHYESTFTKIIKWLYQRLTRWNLKSTQLRMIYQMLQSNSYPVLDDLIVWMNNGGPIDIGKDDEGFISVTINATYNITSITQEASEWTHIECKTVNIANPLKVQFYQPWVGPIDVTFADGQSRLINLS